MSIFALQLLLHCHYSYIVIVPSSQLFSIASHLILCFFFLLFIHLFVLFLFLTFLLFIGLQVPLFYDCNHTNMDSFFCFVSSKRCLHKFHGFLIVFFLLLQFLKFFVVLMCVGFFYFVVLCKYWNSCPGFFLIINYFYFYFFMAHVFV